jgi:hypothetical protein
VKDGETFRKCEECGRPTPQPWIAHCGNYCRQVYIRKCIAKKKEDKKKEKP